MIWSLGITSTKCFPEKFPNQKEDKCSRVIFTEVVHFCCPMKTVASRLPSSPGSQKSGLQGREVCLGKGYHSPHSTPRQLPRLPSPPSSTQSYVQQAQGQSVLLGSRKSQSPYP